MIEAPVRIQQKQCVIRVPGAKRALINGERIEITPLPGYWLTGQYLYDEEANEHCWRYDETHFVGLVDGMLVRVREQISGSEAV
jgi:hypothetical protein